MTKAAIAVVAIALPDSVNPSLILGALYLAAGPRRARRTAAFTAAAFAITLAGGLLIAVGLGDLILAIVPTPGDTLKYSLLAAAGFGLMLGGVVIWVRRGALSVRDSRRAERARGGGGSAAAMGAGIAVVELFTAFPYFAAIAVVVGSSTPLAGKVLLLVLYNIVYSLPLIGIVVVCLVMGPRADEFLNRLRIAVMTRWPVIVAPLAVLVGAGLATYGLTRLA